MAATHQALRRRSAPLLPQAMDPDSVRNTFTEIPMTLIENSIKKFYLEDFFYFW